jgi:hypothetical protein
MATRRPAVSAFAVAAALFAPWSAPASAEEDAERRRQGHSLVGIIGQWTPVQDAGAALKIDGERWNGQTTRAQLEAVRGSLFPVLTESFVSNATASGAFPLAVFGGAREFSSGTIRVQFKLVGGKSDQNAGIVIGLEPSGDYLFVRYNTKDGNVAVWRYANGQREVLTHGEEHQQLAMNTWHELTVTVSGTKVTGQVTGTKLSVQHTLGRPLAGRVGVWTKRDAITVFKNYRVTS